jgi:thymidylate synthase
MNFKVIKNNMNNLDKQYQSLLKDILEEGTLKTTRNGKTLSVFGRQIRHNMSDGFPLLTGKKLYFKGIVTELLWFLRGDTNIKFLVDNGCNIWVGDSFFNYIKEKQENKNIKVMNKDHLNPDGRPYTKEEFINKIKTDDEFAKKWGELGPIYGKQWRNWMGFHEGQHDILKVVNGVEQHKDYLVGNRPNPKPNQRP